MLEIVVRVWNWIAAKLHLPSIGSTNNSSRSPRNPKSPRPQQREQQHSYGSTLTPTITSSSNWPSSSYNTSSAEPSSVVISSDGTSDGAPRPCARLHNQTSHQSPTVTRIREFFSSHSKGSTRPFSTSSREEVQARTPPSAPRGSAADPPAAVSDELQDSPPLGSRTQISPTPSPTPAPFGYDAQFRDTFQPGQTMTVPASPSPVNGDSEKDALVRPRPNGSSCRLVQTGSSVIQTISDVLAPAVALARPTTLSPPQKGTGGTPEKQQAVADSDLAFAGESVDSPDSRKLLVEEDAQKATTTVSPLVTSPHNSDIVL